MNRIVTLAFKDLAILRREREALFWIFVFPLVFALFFGYLSGGGGGPRGKLHLVLVDRDGSDESGRFLDRLRGSDAVELHLTHRAGQPYDADSAREAVRRGEFTAFLIIPPGYGAAADALWQRSEPLELGIDPARNAEAGMLEGVLMQALFGGMQDLFTNPARATEQARKALASIKQDPDIPRERADQLTGFLQELETLMTRLPASPAGSNPFSPEGRLKKVPVAAEQTGRPRSAYEVTFPSSVTWGMYGCIITFAISIVTERTKGTLIRLRMSPLTWAEIVAGKGLACFLVSTFVAVLLMVLGRMLFGVRVSNVFLLGLAIVCAAFCYTGLMMAVAGFGKTEKAVSGAAAAIFMPLAMIGGGMVPLIFMPDWMRLVSNISPTKWNIQALEGAIWRGSSFVEILWPCGMLVAIGLAGFYVGVVFLKRRAE